MLIFLIYAIVLVMNKILRYITLVSIFIIPFIPLFVSNSFFFPFITGKNFIFRIVIEIGLAAWIILALTDRAYRPRKSWILYGFAAFVALMAIADATGVSPFKSFWSNYERMEGWVTLIHLLGYFLMLGTVLAKEKLWDAFFQTSLGVNLVVILYSMLQLQGFLTINQGGARLDATFGNSAYLAIYALFQVFIAALYLVKKKDMLFTFSNWFLALGFNVGFIFFVLPNLSGAAIKDPSTVLLWAFLIWVAINVALYLTAWAKQEKIMYWLTIIFSIVALYNTATRGAILGLIGGVAVAAIIVAVFEKHNKLFRKSAIGVIIAAVVVVGAFFALRNTTFVRTNPVLSRFASISPTEATTLSRFKLWHMALEGFAERPILGWGQENFNYVFNTYYNPELYNQEQWFDRTHNVIFDWLIAGGVLGLASYLLFFGAVIYYVWKSKGDHAFSVAERGVLTGLLVAYFIHNLFVFDNLTSYLMFIAVASYVYHRTTVHHAHAEMMALESNKVIVPIAVVALVVALYAVNVRPILANRTLIDALSVPATAPDITPVVNYFKNALSYNTFGNAEIREQILSRADQYSSVQQQITGKDALVALALEEGKKQIEQTPDDARYYVFYGTYLARTGNIPEAIKMLTKANELSPQKQSIIFALAGTYLSTGQYDLAKGWLKKAYEAEPSYDAARLAYAATAIYTNDTKLADELLKEVSTSTIATSNDLIQAYYAAKQYTKLIAIWKYQVAHDPSAQNHVSLAAAYLYAGDKKNAIAELQEAIKLEPAFKDQGEAYIKQIKEGKLP
jgi:O-antigen ligase/tetratricopeptide (TPR) repeat protein